MKLRSCDLGVAETLNTGVPNQSIASYWSIPYALNDYNFISYNFKSHTFVQIRFSDMCDLGRSGTLVAMGDGEFIPKLAQTGNRSAFSQSRRGAIDY